MLRTLVIANVVVASVYANTCTVFPDVDFVGNDIATTTRANPGDCCADCQATPRCTAYNWDTGVCYLKSAKGASAPLPGGVSGVVDGLTPAPTTPKPTPSPTKTPPTTPSPTTNAPTCQRIRKSWEALTAAEKDTFTKKP
ncbi:hypothetical protein H310_02464 [Aphanomyces invadans]|uniref:Apple domain-containing protein n=1 Tax=Aphanomyces invadans TaxID=157072 RepID=A0A024UR54_9STRA|nr:hypothetical protein H310_02464 [Aphanomyces invadans]ETW08103.1 hypothetical protein H310_02464 [Aphanomyces invadans]|eukprot:XP_008864196.1 hypothetical protein H310_02464 [Aphanomyces invadans]